MLPGDRLICAFVSERKVGATFRLWPLHVTIVPWFRLNAANETIVYGLERALKPIMPFESVGDDKAWFGPHRNRLARLLVASSPFVDVEERVRKYLHKKHAWLADETTKGHRVFRPHVTTQGSWGLRRGETFVCDRLYIVEQKGDYKEIISEICLGKETA